MLELHFLRPAWLAVVPLAILFAVLIWRRRDRGGNWRWVCDPHLLGHLLLKGGENRRAWAAGLVGVAGVIAATALAGPAWERVRQPMVYTLYGRVMVLDLSRSMDATDVAPTRLMRARRKVIGLLERSGDLQTGLVVFAGDAFAVTPLTDDHRTLVSILPVLDTRVMPHQGSRVDLGLEQAQRLLQAGGVSDGEVVVVSDGLKGERAIAAAADLYAEGYRVSVLAVGTVAGGLIRLEDGGYLRGLNGRIVKPSVTLPALQRLADAGGGRLVRAAGDDSDLQRLTENTAVWRRLASVREAERITGGWRDQGPWLVLTLLPLAALAFRRGWLLGLPLVLVLQPQAPLRAASVADEMPPDTSLSRCLDDSGSAAATPGSDSAAQAIELFRNGRYLQAASLFACGDDADAHYNRGTSLARAWRFEQALAAFDQTLARDPAHVDALHNRAV
ncbi:MAG: VWA domain-containing protein, partial [Gammaproteobacteria bacterium]|nr:VWA domain-containing protein [Gammaproteobacteria bacterium]